MTRKKDLEHLHVRIKHSTAENLRNWAEDLGSIGEVIDFLVANFEKESNNMDKELEKESIQETLARLVAAVDDLGKKIDQK